MSKPASDTSAKSSTAGEGANTPASSSSTSSHSHSVPVASLRGLRSQQTMEETSTKDPAAAAEREENVQPADTKAEQETEDTTGKLSSPTKKSKCKNPEHKKQKKDKKTAAGKKAQKTDSASDSDSSDNSSDDDSPSSSSEEEQLKNKKKKLARGKKSKKSKAKGSKKGKKSELESDSSDSDSDDSSSDDSDAELKAKLKKLSKAKKARGKKLAKAKKASGESEEEELEEDETDISAQPDLDAELRAIESKIAALRLQQNAGRMALPKLSRAGRSRYPSFSGLSGSSLSGLGRRGNLKMPKLKQAKADLEDDDEEESKYYKRVDQLWDTSIHNFKLKESAEEDDTEFSEYAFLVRRTFNWENQYQDTLVDIKSKQLRMALQEVMKGCKSVSLEAKEPSIDPNLLFLYLDELRAFYKTTLKSKIKAEKKRKVIKKLEQQRAQVKALVGYIDQDYADTKKTLYPLLKAGNITFELMWALYKPGDICVTSLYGQWDEPRCFKVDYANKCSSMMRGQWWCIEGTYLEYDGKAFGFGDFEVDVDSFKGPRKISSLATYPLKYHREEQKVRKQILERSERFVAMAGMHYKFHKVSRDAGVVGDRMTANRRQGLAFAKKKKQVLKININGRVMIDPATFRRVNPNYQISYIKPKEADHLFGLSDDEDSDEEGCCSCGGGSDDEEDGGKGNDSLSKKFDIDKPRYKYKWDKNEKGNVVFMAVEVDEDGDPLQQNRAVDKLAENTDSKSRSFTEEELLLTSPVVLGFAFSEKLWLEFTISGIHDITWNEKAFDSLVLPPNQKSIVRALVESHKFSAHKAIDDVVQGKGKGLVSVLHGPPGTGKTLTAEGISEMLKCPLYMVSAGELGTDPARLEHELQKILDIAHSWGAILLLDEADVFLEKREVHDIHRNALGKLFPFKTVQRSKLTSIVVSIFLRLLEYFQGILVRTQAGRTVKRS